MPVPPRDPGQATRQIKQDGKQHVEPDLGAVQKKLEGRAGQVRSIALDEFLPVLFVCLPPHPGDKRPEERFPGAMRVSRLVSLLMVLAVLGRPINGPIFQAERAEQCQEVIQSFRAFERPMRQQAVIGDADS